MNGISLACRWWPNVGRFVIFQGIQTIIPKKSYIFVIFQWGGGGGLDPLSPLWIGAWVWVFIFNHTLCIRAVNALSSLHICTGSPESSLLTILWKPNSRVRANFTNKLSGQLIQQRTTFKTVYTNKAIIILWEYRKFQWEHRAFLWEFRAFRAWEDREGIKQTRATFLVIQWIDRHVSWFFFLFWRLSKFLALIKSRLLFSSAEMIKKPLWQTVWTQIWLLL